MSFDYCGPKSPLGEKINCITLTKDFFEKHNINSVKDNLTRNFLSFRGVPIQYMNQVHGKNYEFISSRSLTPSENVDALFCTKSNLALAALSADCLPIALSKSDGSEFSVIHAGWKGLAAGVIESSLSVFANSNENLNAWIGPSISKDNYEVGEDLFDAFVKKDKSSLASFIKKDSNKWLFDLRGEAERILRRFKIKVQTCDVCTYESKSLYSYRKHKTDKRLVTIIWRNI